VRHRRGRRLHVPKKKRLNRLETMIPCLLAQKLGTCGCGWKKQALRCMYPRVLGRCSRLYGAEAPASGATPDKARMRAAFRAWQRLKAQGGVASLYPQIEHCHDRNQAIFDANLALGIKMLGAQSVLKAAAVSHLEIAHALFPDNIAALGNYAIALAWHGRFNEADTLFRHGAQFMPEQFAQTTGAL